LRYGEGNTSLLPVVGISGGEPDPYNVETHTSETTPRNLTNAQSVTFAPRPREFLADVYTLNSVNKDYVRPGDQVSYTLDVGNSGPDGASPVVVKNPIPAGTVFVSCNGCNQGSPLDENGAVSVNLVLGSHSGTSITVVVRVTALPGATISDTVTASSPVPDPNPQNNSATAPPVQVVAELVVAPTIFSPDGGTYNSAIAVVITCATGGNTFIRYTTNGQDPTQTDLWIPSGFYVIIDRNTVLKARAFRDGWVPSSVKSANYIIALNPIDDPLKFVRQQYLDFLSREPDQDGWDYWTNQILQCAPSDQPCIHNRRVAVSDAFFFEPEF
jgi:uncharacterized repeat protein (TIGR01451 family)